MNLVKILPSFIESEFFQTLDKENKIVLDNSTFVQFDACAVKGVLGGALRKQPSMSQVHLDFGGAFHEGIDALFTGKNIKEAWEIVLATDSYAKLDDSHPTKTRENLKKLLVSASIHLDTACPFTPLYFQDGTPIIEQSFKLFFGAIPHPLDESRSVEVYWEGKIDMLALYQGSPWIVDHKTTSVMGEKFADTYARSSQMLGYFWAVLSLIQKGLRVFNKDGSEVDLKSKLLKGVCINGVAIRKTGFEFREFPIPLPYGRVAEWVDETLLKLSWLSKELYEFSQSGLIAPTRENCVTKYGRCPFFDVCDAPIEMRDRLLNSSEFVTSDWSPHK